MRYHAAPKLVSELYRQGLLEAMAYDERPVFGSVRMLFATEGVLPSAEAAYAVHDACVQAIDPAHEKRQSCFSCQTTGISTPIHTLRASGPGRARPGRRQRLGQGPRQGGVGVAREFQRFPAGGLGRGRVADLIVDPRLDLEKPGPHNRGGPGFAERHQALADERAGTFPIRLGEAELGERQQDPAADQVTVHVARDVEG